MDSNEFFKTVFIIALGYALVVVILLGSFIGLMILNP